MSDYVLSRDGDSGGWRVHGPGGIVEGVDAVLRVECDEHQGRRRHVRTLYRSAHSHAWHVHSGGDPAAVLDTRDAQPRPLGLADAVERSPMGVDGYRTLDWSRTRFRFECKAHRSGAFTATDARLFPVLDTLAAHGRDVVTLSTLGAIVRRS